MLGQVNNEAHTRLESSEEEFEGYSSGELAEVIDNQKIEEDSEGYSSGELGEPKEKDE